MVTVLKLLSMKRPNLSLNKVVDAAVVVTVCFGWFILGSIGAVASGFPTRAFDDSTFISIISIEVLLATVALCYLRVRGHDLSQLVPSPTGIGCLVGLVLYAITTLVTWPIYEALGRPDLATQPIEQMVAWASISLPWLLGVSIVNGFYEELFLIGYLLRELEAFGASLAIGVTVLVRVLYHLYQGPLGTISVAAFGVVVAVYYWRTRKLWPVVFAHIFADVAGFSMR